MKFQQLLSLQKHLDVSAANLPKSYLVLHPVREERRASLEKIAKKISLFTKGEIRFLEGSSWEEVYQSLATPSFFGEIEILVWMVEKEVPEQTLEKLQRYIANPSSHAFLLLGIESIKTFPDLYTQSKKDLVFLDLTEEKPWEKEKRLQQEFLQAIRNEGKTITPKALERLLSVSDDILTLESELSKVLLYVGEKKAIQEEDVQAICAPSAMETGWKQAEALLWEKDFTVDEADLSFFLAFLGQVRFLLQQARLIYLHLGQRREPEEIAKLLNLRLPQLQKIIDRIRKYRLGYLEKSLEILYDLELMAKDSPPSATFLLSLIKIRITHAKRTYAR